MARKSSGGTRLSHLQTHASDPVGVHVVIDTPQGSRNKFEYDEELGLFKLSGVLPAGASFPFDFGFVPSTKGGDGDPLDVLVLMDEAAFVGCVVVARLIGVVEAEQTEESGETVRNDRLIAVAEKARNHKEVRSLGQLSEHLLEEIEHFFISYNEIKGVEFKPLGRFGPKRAENLIEEGMRLFRAEERKGSAKKSRKSSGGAAKKRR
ncbi:MAG TPA: inorganic diphosphatase [Pyrinomonadaceae bacterium]|jgi:inorganic pyrophosphatase|nr:inorganic diphosphatase [Pyrinomonadaceae bacterium]